MTTRTRNKILKLRKLGYKPETIAMIVDATVAEIRSVTAKDEVKRAKERPKGKEVKSQAQLLIDAGADPAVVRANFGE